MNSVASAVAIALGAFAVTEFIKTVLPWPLQPWTKMVLPWSLIVVAVVAYDLPSLCGVGAAGGAMVVHRAHRWLAASGDAHQAAVIRAAGGRSIR